MKNTVFVLGLAALMLGSCSGKEKETRLLGEPFGMNIACADFGSVFPGTYVLAGKRTSFGAYAFQVGKAAI